MNWNERMNNKAVDSIIVGSGQGGQFIKNTAEKINGTALVFEYSFHGEYDEGWVVELSQDGKELRRFNARYISEIKWLL